MYLHHMVFRQLQMRPANNKLMNLEHDRIIWNDQTRELYQKRHIYSIIISEHSGNIGIDVYCPIPTSKLTYFLCTLAPILLLLEYQQC